MIHQIRHGVQEYDADDAITGSIHITAVDEIEARVRIRILGPCVPGRVMLSTMVGGCPSLYSYIHRSMYTM